MSLFLGLIATTMQTTGSVNAGSTSMEFENSNPQNAALEDHSAISIVGDDALAGFFAGNGTMDGMSWGTAYIFDNFSINSYSAQLDCIAIRDTSSFIIIQNSTLRTYFALGCSAIYLENCSNIQIKNITVVQAQYGMQLSDTEKIEISNCSIVARTTGIYGTQTLNTTFSNTILDTTEQAASRAIYFVNANDTTSLNNIIRSKSDGCTFIDSYFTQIINCTLDEMSGRPFMMNGGNSSLIQDCNITSLSNYDSKYTDHHNFLIQNNNFTLEYNGIHFIDCNDGNITGNNFQNGGLSFEGTISNFSIPETNLLNGYGIKYIENTSNLDLTIERVGQFILNNVNDSMFSDIEISNAYKAIFVIRSNNLSLIGCNINDSIANGYGLYFESGSDLTVVNSTFLRNYISIGGHLNQFTLRNCTLIGNDLRVGYGLYALQASNISLIDNFVQYFGAGIYIKASSSLYFRRNTLVDTLVDIGNNDDVDVDTSNTLYGKPIYYLQNQFNQTYEPSSPALFIIENSSYITIAHSLLNGGNLAFYISDSHHILIYNVSIVNFRYAFEIQDSYNISIINCSLTNLEGTAVGVSGVEGLNITRTYFSNTTTPISLGSCTNVSIEENWFEDAEWGIEFEDTISNTSISYNSFIPMNEEWIYLPDDNESLYVIGNVNATEYDPDYYGELDFDYQNIWIWSDAGDDTTTSDDDGGTDDTSATDDSASDDDNPNLPGDDDGLDLPTLIALISAGVVILAIGITFYLRNRRESNPETE